jgi:oligosaccharyltransferase complex subunit epsilon
MPPKARVPEKPAGVVNSAPAVKSTSGSSKSSKSGSLDAQAIVQDVWSKYVQKTSQRVKLLDSFMVFLVVVGVLQFVYCMIVGNFVRIHPGPFYKHLATVFSMP